MRSNIVLFNSEGILGLFCFVRHRKYAISFCLCLSQKGNHPWRGNDGSVKRWRNEKVKRLVKGERVKRWLTPCKLVTLLTCQLFMVKRWLTPCKPVTLLTCQLFMVKKWLPLLACYLINSLTCQLIMVKKWLPLLACYLVNSLTCQLIMVKNGWAC